MSRKWTAICCVALGGCSAESGDNSGGTGQRSLLVGKWLVVVNDVCVAGWTFDGSQYEGDTGCLLQSDTYGIEAEVGSYAATEDRIDLVPELASCTLNRNFTPYSFLYTVNANVLRLTSNRGVATFDKWSDDPNALGSEGGVVARYGCLEPDGFYDGEIVPVN